MKKILIFYASFGGGHFTAAKAVKDYIDENFNDTQTEMSDFMKYISRPLEGLTTAAYREITKRVPEFYGKIYENSEKGLLFELSKDSGELMAAKLNRLLKGKNPDIIISTHYLSSQMCSYLKKKGYISCVLGTIITDFGVHKQWLVGHEQTDHFFIPDDAMREEMTDRGVDADKIHVTGLPVSSRFFRHYDRKKVCGEFGLDHNKEIILFFGGGEFGLGKDRTVRILKVFIENLKECQIVAISGKNEYMKSKFDELVEGAGISDRVKVLVYTDKIPELMSVASLVVSKPGGLTTAEALTCSLPMLIINPIPGQEEKNAAFLENADLGIWLRSADTEEEIKDFLLSSKDRLKKIKQNAGRLKKENSAKKICEIMLK